MKNENKTGNDTTDISKDIQTKDRRKALKSLLVASSVVVGSQALSKDWTRPLVESVILPAHAQTSLVANGTFDSGVTVNVKLPSKQPWYANNNLLETLIPSADAVANQVASSVCGTNNGSDENGSYQVLFNINGSQVDICVSSLGTSGDQCTQSGTTTISGQNITGITITMDAAYIPGSVQESAILSNLVVNDAMNKINGTLEIIQSENFSGSAWTCSETFECELTTSTYVCNTGCNYDDD